MKSSNCEVYESGFPFLVHTCTCIDDVLQFRMQWPLSLWIFTISFLTSFLTHVTKLTVLLEYFDDFIYSFCTLVWYSLILLNMYSTCYRISRYLKSQGKPYYSSTSVPPCYCGYGTEFLFFFCFRIFQHCIPSLAVATLRQLDRGQSVFLMMISKYCLIINAFMYYHDGCINNLWTN